MVNEEFYICIWWPVYNTNEYIPSWTKNWFVYFNKQWFAVIFKCCQISTRFITNTIPHKQTNASSHLISPNSFQFNCSPDIHNFNLHDISAYHMTCPTHTRFLWWPRWTLPLYTWSEQDPTSYNVPSNKQLYIYVRGQQCVRRNMIKSNDKSDISQGYCFNSLRPSDAIWRPRSGSTLAQVMACCLTAPSHYLNQCWLIIRKV